MAPLDLSLLALVTVVAAVVQGATGFGFAIVATPAFLWVVGSLTAVQLIIALSLAVSLVLAPGLFRAAPRPLLDRLVGGSLVGLPLGLIAFSMATLGVVQLAVGALIVLLAARLLIRGRAPATAIAPPGRLHELAVGFASGAMTTSLGMPGPAVVLHLVARDLTGTATRATTLTLFTLSYAAALALQAGFGGMGGGTWRTIAVLTPAAIAGALLGARLAKHLDQERFRAIVLAILLVTGLATIVGALV